MKKIIFWFFRIYSKTEKECLEIYALLYEQTEKTYNEQTTFGNVYNANIEFLMANKFVKQLVKENDEKSLAIVGSGLQASFTKSLTYIK